MKEYKIVPAPVGCNVKKGQSASVFDDYAKIINANCIDGWDYHSMETIHITENPGCLGGGAKNARTTVHYMLIFVRERSSKATAPSPVK